MCLSKIRKLFYKKRIELEKIEPQKGVDGRAENFYVTKSNCKSTEIKPFYWIALLYWDRMKIKIKVEVLQNGIFK